MSFFIRPEISEDRIEQIKDIMEKNPDWNRTTISKHICMEWGWQNPNGQLKDISCRRMLCELEKKGVIKLPARQTPSRSNGGADKIKHLDHNTIPIIAKISELRPLRISNVSISRELSEFKSYIDQFHYLKFDRSIGENMKYMIYDRNDRPLSCLMFGSAAWSCRGRDNYIGWDKSVRTNGLRFMTNNSRLLIFPWVKAPHLASHILSLISHRISSDWIKKYGHPLYCLETYVETGRFRGTVYVASNWIKVGTTTGRGRDGGHHEAILPIKDVYIYPLVKNFKKMLTFQERVGYDK
jgi:hypothetical protein